MIIYLVSIIHHCCWHLRGNKKTPLYWRLSPLISRDCATGKKIMLEFSCAIHAAFLGWKYDQPGHGGYILTTTLVKPSVGSQISPYTGLSTISQRAQAESALTMCWTCDACSIFILSPLLRKFLSTYPLYLLLYLLAPWLSMLLGPVLTMLKIT
jgi:hypothetical protein